jgi:hypothetical protein
VHPGAGREGIVWNNGPSVRRSEIKQTSIANPFAWDCQLIWTDDVAKYAGNLGKCRFFTIAYRHIVQNRLQRFPLDSPPQLRLPIDTLRQHYRRAIEIMSITDTVFSVCALAGGFGLGIPAIWVIRAFSLPFFVKFVSGSFLYFIVISVS